jgi:hypothetical protein
MQMGSAHCVSQVGSARGSWPTWPYGPRPRSKGALAVGAPRRRPGRLWPTGGDGRWGTAARARGGGEGSI